MKLYKIFVYTVLFLMVLSVLIPVLWVMLASVKEDGDFYESPWRLPSRLDLANFAEAWEAGGMGDYFLSSVLVTSAALIILLAAAIPASYVLSRHRFLGRNLLNSYFKAGLFVNLSYIAVPIFLMLSDTDKILGGGLLLNNRLVLALVYASCAIPFTVYLLSGYFSALPRDFEEAAYVDGCSRWRTLWNIMVPLARPGIITVILFNFLAFWNEYIIAITLMTENSVKTLPVGLMNLMKAQNAAAQYGRMYAGLVIVMLPTLILYIALQKKITKGMTEGGSKG